MGHTLYGAVAPYGRGNPRIKKRLGEIRALLTTFIVFIEEAARNNIRDGYGLHNVLCPVPGTTQCANIGGWGGEEVDPEGLFVGVKLHAPLKSAEESALCLHLLFLKSFL